MSNPPPLPKRNVQQDPPPDPSVIATVSESINDAPPELPSRKKMTAPDPVHDNGVERPSQNADLNETSEPPSARFVAPLPGPPTSAHSGITGAFRTVLEMLPSQRQDTPEEAAIRRRLEEEQIARYMNSFSKHVQYLRMDPDSAAKRSAQDNSRDVPVSQHKPKLEDFRSLPLEGKENPLPTEAKVVDENEAASTAAKQREIEEAPIDWFGYYAAVCLSKRNTVRRDSDIAFVKLAVYYLHTYIPSLSSNNIQPLHLATKPIEREPFTISRLRSSVERLYVNARSPWGRLFVTIGSVAMWHDVAKSMKWLFVSLQGLDDSS